MKARTKKMITMSILQPVTAWKKPILALMLISGCANVPSGTAICDGSEMLRTDHAASLVEDGGPLSKQTGAALIISIDAGCEQ